MPSPESTLIAVDVGNSRVKLGRFGLAPHPSKFQAHPRLDESESPRRLREPESTLYLANDGMAAAALDDWLRQTKPVAWWIASVNRPALTRLLGWIGRCRPEDRITLVVSGDLGLKVDLERPDMVGIDRLLDAVAANALRDPARPAVVVDVGSAITVDLVSAAGAFQGGAILPGLGMAARALHEFTDLLPLIEAHELGEPPPVVGPATVPAMRSGLFWGAVGAVRELVQHMAGDEAQVFLTGGAGMAVARLLGPRAMVVPHLTLSGIALTAARAAANTPDVEQ